MASFTHSAMLNSLVLLCLLCSLWSGFSSEGEETGKWNENVTYLSLVHKNGPSSLSFFHGGKGKTGSDSEYETLGKDKKEDMKLDIADSTGSNYLVKVSLAGEEFKLSFDTGSVLTWTQCSCKDQYSHCYYQLDEPFNVHRGFTTYPCADANSKCESTKECEVTCSINEQCKDRMLGRGHDDLFAKELKQQFNQSEEGNYHGKNKKTKGECRYTYKYGDGSTTNGVLGDAALTIGNHDFKEFLFGCGNENNGIYSPMEDGILGLAYDEKFSILKQTSGKYDKKFSYCIPPTPDNVGFLRFGHESHPKETLKEHMIRHKIYYMLKLDYVAVDDKIIFHSKADVIVDSGTTFTKLPRYLFGKVKSKYNAAMNSKGYSEVLQDDCSKPEELQEFEVCHKIEGGFKSPDITFRFTATSVNLPNEGITVLSLDKRYACLAFQKDEKNEEVIIWGSYQQKGIEINFDVGNNEMWFRELGDCKPVSLGGNSVSF